MTMYKILILLSTTLVLQSCGTSSDDDAPENATDETENQNGTPLSGTMAFNVTAATYDQDDGDYSGDKYQTCRKDLASGLLSIELGNSDNLLALKIKNAANSPKTYHCRQATNNATDDGKLGDLFTSCMVDTRLTAEDAAGTSGYSMHRGTTEMSPFAYAGACTVTVDTIDDAVSGSFACAEMVQTTLDSAYRNPISAATTADITGDFSCVLVKK